MDKSATSISNSIAAHITHILNCLTTLEQDHKPKSNIICDQEKLLIQTSCALIIQNIQNLFRADLDAQDSKLLDPDIVDIDHRLQTLQEAISLGNQNLSRIKMESQDLILELHKVLYL